MDFFVVVSPHQNQKNTEGDTPMNKDEKQNEVNVTIAEVLAVLNGLDERVTALENR